jgi:hypothetical protein
VSGQLWKVGDRVRFNHEHPNGPVRVVTKVVSYPHGPMVAIEGMAGFFAVHIFMSADSNHDDVRDAAAGER